MAVETDRSWQALDLRTRLSSWTQRIGRLFGRVSFSGRITTLTGRIVIVNLLGLAILISGIVYLNQSTANLIDAQVKACRPRAKSSPRRLLQRPQRIPEPSSSSPINCCRKKAQVKTPIGQIVFRLMSF